MTVVSISRIYLGGVTLIGEVCESSKRCLVEKNVLIFPGAMRFVKRVGAIQDV